MTTGAVLLAAGRSTRFGTANKLLAALNGRPVVSYSANALRSLHLDFKIAVVQDAAVGSLLTDFLIVRPAEPEPQQSDSLRAGLLAAMEIKASKVLVVLADMPFVTPFLLDQILNKCAGGSAAAATAGSRALPPACFLQAHFSALIECSGDEGARELLRDLSADHLVTASFQDLRDIDTPFDLGAANDLLASIGKPDSAGPVF
jgi:molybdenum cofactor cytidylyltransferase